jgi:hypothetical protein
VLGIEMAGIGAPYFLQPSLAPGPLDTVLRDARSSTPAGPGFFPFDPSPTPKGLDSPQSRAAMNQDHYERWIFFLGLFCLLVGVVLFVWSLW